MNGKKAKNCPDCAIAKNEGSARRREPDLLEPEKGT
jgi:hypothetical protein